MRIAILTQPLHTNYGGLLQAYALQKVLKELGHHVVTEREKYQYSWKSSIIRMMQRAFPSIVRIIRPQWLNMKIISPAEMKKIQQNTNEFICKYISTVPLIKTDDVKNYDAFIVGSDQVWRPLYNPNLGHMFLDFVPENWAGKRIAYAASFGTEKWELTSEDTIKASKHLAKFNLITVREASAVKLVHDKLQLQAYHVLDPTMLLSSNDYIELCKNEDKRSGMFSYILDTNYEKEQAILTLVKALNVKFFQTFPKRQYEKDWGAKVEDCVYPGVEEWIASYRDAQYVITDSFHGTVFSILFNRPFLSIVNSERGAARFSSLLDMFGLRDRLVESPSDINQQRMLTPINWDEVNKRLTELRTNSLEFLKNRLNSHSI